MITKQDLCSMALLKLGEQPLTSINADTASAQLARTLYDTTIDSLISTHPWHFASKNFEIEKNENDEFIIPSNVLRILRCDGHIIGNKIISKSQSVKILALQRVEPEFFPSYFVSLAATKLAIEFCVPLTGNQQMLRILINLYDAEYQNAKFIDSTADINTGVRQFSLIDARF